MAIPENIIDAVQNKTDIVEVISRYIPLKKTGRNYKAPCPFHHEKTPSFVVSPDKQIYHCFGCNAGGNVFSFLMRYENIEFPEAVEMLADKAGVKIPRYSGQSRENVSLANQLYRINELAAQFFQGILAANNIAKEYLRQRGVSDEIVKKLMIGMAPDGWEALLDYFKKKGVGSNLLEKAGLAVPNEKGGHYDRFRRRITFPIIDLKDRIIGFGARVLDSSLPKYINSPETYIYSKGHHLYGLNFSREHIRKEGYTLVVEGYLDFIIPYQTGIKNLIATLGTALTRDQIKLLKRLTDTVIMVYDPDAAGEAASLRNMDLFISEDMNVYVAELPAGYDPDTCIRELGSEEFLKCVKAGKNLFDYKLEKILPRFDINTAYGKAGIAGEMLPTISRINNAIIKASLIKRLADRLSVDEESIKAEMKKVKPDYGVRIETEKLVFLKSSPRSAEELLLALMLEDSSFIGKIKNSLSLEEFKNTAIREIAEAMFRLHNDGEKVSPARLINFLNNSNEVASLISEASGLAEMFVDRERVLSDCVTRIKRDCVRGELENLRREIKTAHDSKDETRLKDLIARYNSLVKNQ